MIGRLDSPAQILKSGVQVQFSHPRGQPYLAALHRSRAPNRRSPERTSAPPMEDVDFNTCTIRFANAKNGDSRSVPITDTLSDPIQGLEKPIDPEAPLFPEREPLVLTRAFGRLVRRLGLRDITFHDLRHDAASTLAMAGVPLRTVAGHRDMRMTTRYAHLSPQHLREAIKALDTPMGDSSGSQRSSMGTI